MEDKWKRILVGTAVSAALSLALPVAIHAEDTETLIPPAEADILPGKEAAEQEKKTAAPTEPESAQSKSESVTLPAGEELSPAAAEAAAADTDASAEKQPAEETTVESGPVSQPEAAESAEPDNSVQTPIEQPDAPEAGEQEQYLPGPEAPKPSAEAAAEQLESSEPEAAEPVGQAGEPEENPEQPSADELLTAAGEEAAEEEETEQPAEKTLTAAEETLAAEPAGEAADGTVQDAPIALSLQSEQLLQKTAFSGEQSSDETTGGADGSDEAAAPAVVQVGGTTLGTEDITSGWNSGTGWRYHAQSNSVALVNCTDAISIHAENTGAAICVAGLNHIGTLYADGDVTITGTGIVLIDSVEMLEGTQLSLLTDMDRYSEGSAALFVRQDDGTYLMVNGSTTGILDGTYTIPEGITLVVPEGCTLDMCTTATVTREDPWEDTTETHPLTAEEASSTIDETGWVSVKATAPVLSVAKGAVLQLAQNASLKLQSYSLDLKGFDDSSSVLQVSSRLEVSGSLILDGLVENYGLGSRKSCSQIVLEEDSAYSGSAVLSDVELYYHGTAGNEDTLYLGDNARLGIIGDGPANLQICSGTVYAAVKNNAQTKTTNIGTIAVAEGAKLVLAAEKGVQSISISESITGSWERVSGDVYLKGNLISENIIYDVTVTSGIPYQSNTLTFDRLNYLADMQVYGMSDRVSSYNSEWEEQGALELSEITYESLHQAASDMWYFEVVCYNRQTGCVTKQLLQSGDGVFTGSVDDIVVIRGFMYWVYSPDSGGGESISTVKAANTGTGVLGGSNSGTLNGGAKVSVLSGKRKAGTTDSDNTSGESGNQPGNQPGDQPGDQPGNQPGDQPEDQPGNQPGDQPGDQPGEQPGDQPENQPEKPGTTPEEIPGSNTRTQTDGYTVVVRVTGAGTRFCVQATLGADTLRSLGGGTVPVSFSFTLPAGWNEKDIFAVFSNADGSLTAVRVTYDAASGQLFFSSPCLGDFELVCLQWEGTDCKDPALLEALRKCLSR